MLLAASVSCSGFFFASLFVCSCVCFSAIRNCALILALKLQQILWINAPTAWQMSCIKYKICPAGMGETETERDREMERETFSPWPALLLCQCPFGWPTNVQLATATATDTLRHTVRDRDRKSEREREGSLTWNCSLNTELCPSFWQHTNVHLYYVYVLNYSSKFCKWGVSGA